MKHMFSFVAVVCLCLGVGCAKSNSCDALAKKLCDGKDDATCQKTKTWLSGEMTGPDKQKLSADEAEQGCKMIVDDDAVLESYKKEAARKVK